MRWNSNQVLNGGSAGWPCEVVLPLEHVMDPKIAVLVGMDSMQQPKVVMVMRLAIEFVAENCKLSC